MPASYAHYRFGKLLIPGMPGEVRQCIQRFRRMYDTGLQGPDLFFYYNPLAKTAVGDLGNLFHSQSGREFFTRACAAADSEAGLAYLYGLLGHYCLDSTCHPFVNRMVEIGEASHVALESEFDRCLMEKDKIPQPHTYDRSKFIRLTRGECMTAAGFFPPATGGNIHQCVGIMGISLRFLGGPNRERTEKLIRRFKPNYLEQLIPTEAVEDYGFQIGELTELYDQALAKYPLMLQQLLQHRKDGTPFSDIFAPDFG